MKPYERLLQESEPAWHAFVCYRDLGVERGLTPVAERLKKSVALLSRWVAKHNWKERAIAWDNAQDRAKTDATTKAIAKITEKAVAKQEAITANRIMQETGRLGFSKITDVMTWKDIDGIVDSDKLSPEVAATIESIEFGCTDTGVRFVKKIKLYGKVQPLNLQSTRSKR